MYMFVCVFSRAFGYSACIVSLRRDCGAHPDVARFNYHINEHLIRGILPSNTEFNTAHDMTIFFSRYSRH